VKEVKAEEISFEALPSDLPDNAPVLAAFAETLRENNMAFMIIEGIRYAVGMKDREVWTIADYNIDERIGIYDDELKVIDIMA